MTPLNRRAEDPRLTKVIDDVAALQTQHVDLMREVAVNTVLTKQIKEILEGFVTVGRVVKFIAKWASILAAIAVSFKAGWGVIAGFIRLSHTKEKS